LSLKLAFWNLSFSSYTTGLGKQRSRTLTCSHASGFWLTADQWRARMQPPWRPEAREWAGALKGDLPSLFCSKLNPPCFFYSLHP
jgi:hypothetical protein